MGLHARMMGQAMRKQSTIISKTNTIVIYINQLREKVGLVYGNPEILEDLKNKIKIIIITKT
nr:hypothetical protein [Texas Phoenix palm phytoplasma]